MLHPSGNIYFVRHERCMKKADIEFRFITPSKQLASQEHVAGKAIAGMQQLLSSSPLLQKRSNCSFDIAIGFRSDKETLSPLAAYIINNELSQLLWFNEIDLETHPVVYSSEATCTVGDASELSKPTSVPFAR